MPRVYASNRAWSYTGTESEANASYIWAYFKAKGWSNSAIAGLVGNTTHESYNNPGFHEVGGSGFGIVQWTPSGNYTNWARPRGFPTGNDFSDPEKYMLGQCERIIFELNTGIEFYPNNRYGKNWLGYKNWQSYIHNDLSPEDAAWLFMSNYERPAYSAAMSSLSARQSYARRWFDKFAANSGSSSQILTTAAHAAAQWAIGIANDPAHGYDQGNRWGERGDYDCSAFVITAYEQAGVRLKTQYGATYTGDMRKALLAAGFQDITKQVNFSNGSGLIEGDVLLNTVHHAAICAGEGKIVESRINEKNRVTGGVPGDQTGAECWVRNFYNYPWNYAFRLDGVTAFGNVDSATDVAVLRAIPVTRPNWADETERDG